MPLVKPYVNAVVKHRQWNALEILASVKGISLLLWNSMLFLAVGCLNS